MAQNKQEDTLSVIGLDGQKYHLFLTREEEELAIQRSPIKVAYDLLELSKKVGAIEVSS